MKVSTLAWLGGAGLFAAACVSSPPGVQGPASPMPDRTIEEINWGYQAMLGVMVYTMADTGRISRLSGGRCDPEDEMTTARHLVALMKAALLYSRV